MLSEFLSEPNMRRPLAKINGLRINFGSFSIRSIRSSLSSWSFADRKSFAEGLRQEKISLAGVSPRIIFNSALLKGSKKKSRSSRSNFCESSTFTFLHVLQRFHV